MELLGITILLLTWPLLLAGTRATHVSRDPALDGAARGLDDWAVDAVARRRRSPERGDRPACDAGTNTAAPTAEQVGALRARLAEAELTDQAGPLAAYYLPMGDAHQSEYVADMDKRIKFLSGFSGSNGQVVVSTTAALLWTDGRYFTQADDELPCDWLLMRDGLPGTPSVSEWFASTLQPGQVVGADASQVSYDSWKKLSSELSEAGLYLVAVRDNLVDEVWRTANTRPAYKAHPLEVLSLNYAGVSWSDKVSSVQQSMGDAGATMAVYTALDDIAWLFNLRGSDVVYTPVFFSFAIISDESVTLYIREKDTLLTSEVKSHLGWTEDSGCASTACVYVRDYAMFLGDVSQSAQSMAHMEGKVWFSPQSSQAVYNALTACGEGCSMGVYLQTSIVQDLKARKNPTEVTGLRKCHIRDSVILIDFMSHLEREVRGGQAWTEVSAATELARMRGEDTLNRGLSFETISASGSNGAIIHYKPSSDSDRAITTSHVYLLDSGGQYLDGTTDVTRTFHFGQPTPYQQEAYTRVLMGAINLAALRWPAGLYGRQIDVIARRPLWTVGLDYRHGTGHGIGMYLGVHEGPGRIYLSSSLNPHESPVYENMFFSDEPGYYEVGEFGVRLETIIRVVNATTKYEFGDTQFLEFEPFTLVPFETNLILSGMLNTDQREWLNSYNALIRKEIVEKVLRPSGKSEAVEWVLRRTQPLPTHASYTSGCGLHPPIGLLLLWCMYCVAGRHRW